MQATIEGRDPVFDEPKGESESEPEIDFPGGWCEEVLRVIRQNSLDKHTEDMVKDAQIGTFVQLSRLVSGWNATVAELPPALGQNSTLLASLLAEQVKTREAIESLSKSNESVVAGLRALYKLVSDQAKGGAK